MRGVRGGYLEINVELLALTVIGKLSGTDIGVDQHSRPMYACLETVLDANQHGKH